MFRKNIPAGTVIFYEGEPSDCAYIIESGTVDISTVGEGGRVLLATLGRGEIFGEMGAIDDALRSAAATAVTEVELVVIDRDQLRRRIDQGEPVLSMLLKKMIVRLRNAQRVLLNEPLRTPPGSAETASEDTALHAEVVGAPDGAPDGFLNGALDWLKRETDLRRGLENSEFEPFFQPLVHLGDGTLAGFEALVRWRHPGRGYIPPGDFIDLSEKCGLIRDIDLVVLDAGLRRLTGVRSAGRPVFLSVNLSPHHFTDDAIVGRLARTLAETGYDPALLKVEITETALIGDPNKALDVLRRIKELGVTIALDDFGTGYSSLSYLHRFPIDVLKIDQSFIRVLKGDDRVRSIVETITRLGRSMHLTVVAEGIETADLVPDLLELGCDLGQGYYFSRPVPADAALRLVEAHRLPVG